MKKAIIAFERDIYLEIYIFVDSTWGFELDEVWMKENGKFDTSILELQNDIKIKELQHIHKEKEK